MITISAFKWVPEFAHGQVRDLRADPRLAAYLERCTGRPASRRALEAQIADFRKAA